MPGNFFPPLPPCRCVGSCCCCLSNRKRRWSGRSKAWKDSYRFPSCLVLTAAGLMPVSPTIRGSKIVSVLNNFRSSISGWNFFNAGKLDFEVPISTMQLEGSGWSTAKEVLEPPLSEYKHFTQSCAGDDSVNTTCHTNIFSSLHLDTLQKFRRPKLVLDQRHAGKESQGSFDEEHFTRSCLVTSSGPMEILQNHQKIVPQFWPRKMNKDRRLADLSQGNTNCRMTVPIPKTIKLASRKPSNVQNLSTEAIKGPNSFPQDQQKLAGVQYKSMKKKKASEFCTYEKGLSNGRQHDGNSSTKKRKLPEKSEGNPQKPIQPDCATQPWQDGSFAPVSKDSITKENRVETNGILEIHQEESSSLARNVEKKTAGSRSDKRTPATIDTSLNNEKIQSKHTEGKLKDLTVPELKAFLSANKAKVSGKKEELIQRVLQFLS